MCKNRFAKSGGSKWGILEVGFPIHKGSADSAFHSQIARAHCATVLRHIIKNDVGWLVARACVCASFWENCSSKQWSVANSANSFEHMCSQQYCAGLIA